MVLYILFLFKKFYKKFQFNYIKIFQVQKNKNTKIGLGIGDWGLGIGPQSPSPIPNPQSPIPNPQIQLLFMKFLINYKILYKYIIYYLYIKIKSMVDIEFHFDQIITIIQAELEEPLQEVINRYINKSSLGLNSISFLINGNRINNLQETVESFMSDLDKQNKKVTILVKLIEKDVKDKEQVIAESKDIICPTCKEPCRISINNYNIKLYECDNGHTNDYINLFKFSKIQKVNISQIICDI